VFPNNVIAEVISSVSVDWPAIMVSDTVRGFLLNTWLTLCALVTASAKRRKRAFLRQLAIRVHFIYFDTWIVIQCALIVGE
jgi:hypothetical protein